MIIKLKVAMVSILLFIGSLFLLNGIGVQIPLIEYKGITVRYISSGVVLLIIGVVIAYKWKVSDEVKTKSSITHASQDGSSTTTTIETTHTTHATTKYKEPKL